MDLGTVLSAGALVLCARVLPARALQAATGKDDATAWYPSVYVGIEPSGTVIIVAHRSEMGTGIRTALPMVAADELEADWERVRIEQAIGDPRYGDQNTDGSKSMGVAALSPPSYENALTEHFCGALAQSTTLGG